ncbi:hypothetical protein [Winogradskyella sp.]|uniref:hypothetical protein n=1 Tax=Winogradskyella sp. TaxID=1883156 RepID=UPI002607FD86|nr:hypothetical protein [Winogradskyella sp.]
MKKKEVKEIVDRLLKIRDLKLHETFEISSNELYNFSITRVFSGFMYKFESYLFDDNGSIDKVSISTFFVSLKDFREDFESHLPYHPYILNDMLGEDDAAENIFA